MSEHVMDENGFRRFLKKRGKKPHVVDGLVEQVGAFVSYLADEHGTKLDAATEQHVEEYAKFLAPRDVKARMRGLALYYAFAGNAPLASLSSGIRERLIAGTRKAFRLRQFRGVDVEDVARLEAIGIGTVEDMLTAGKTPEARRRLAERTGIAPTAILELVRLSDLSRLGAVKSVRARLYHDAGLDAPDRFTEWEPAALREYLVEWVRRSGFDGIAPLPKEIRNAIATARRLPKAVDYGDEAA